MKYLHRTAGIITAFCLMIILFITSVEAVVYWTPGYFEKEYAKYNVLDSLPSMTMDDLLHVTDEMMDYLRGDREDLHVTTTMGGEQREFFNEREIAHMEDVQVLFLKALSIRRVCLILGAGLLILMAATKARMGRVLPPYDIHGLFQVFHHVPPYLLQQRPVDSGPCHGHAHQHCTGRLLHGHGCPHCPALRLPVPDSLWCLPASYHKKPQKRRLIGHRLENNAPLQPLLEAVNPLYCILAKK